MNKTRAKELLEKLKKFPNLNGQNNKTHDKYHDEEIPHNHLPGG